MGSPPTVAPRPLTAENLCPSATVVRVHDGYAGAGGGLRGVINNSGGSRNLMITITVQLILFVRQSVDDIYGIACSLGDS